MKITEYTLKTGRFRRPLCLALVSDLHGSDPTAPLQALRQASPDYILMPGDIFERLNGEQDTKHENALRLMKEAAAIAPTFYTTGNHEDGGIRSWNPLWKLTVKERVYHTDDLRAIADTGVTFLGDSFVLKDGIAFGGLYSGLINEGQHPETAWLSDFCRVDGPKILLCHHPEYYPRYLKELPIDLIVSGHAHGGQWRLFGRGVFAPGQGLFPKYTAGIHGGNLVISTGLKPSGHIPRIFNEPELVLIHV